MDQSLARGDGRRTTETDDGLVRVRGAREHNLKDVSLDSDGVIAKRIDLAYQAGTRDGMQKIKRHRSADCVIGGFRYGEGSAGGRKLVGSIALPRRAADPAAADLPMNSLILGGRRLDLDQGSLNQNMNPDRPDHAHAALIAPWFAGRAAASLVSTLR